MNNGICIGFGDKEGKCENKAGGRWSPHWCPECDKARVTHIGEQFVKIAAKAAGRVDPPEEVHDR